MMQRRGWMIGCLATASIACGVGVAPRRARAQAFAPAVDRIGLLLPKSSGPFGRASLAVRAGIEAGFRRDSRDLAVDIYEIDENAQSLAAAYRGMQERGTALVLGPLTRNAATALLQLGEVPITTVALNQIDGQGALPWNVLVFTLAVEQEAVQIADIAFTDARQRLLDARPPRALIVASSSVVGRRGASMFHERWRNLGGAAEAPVELEESALYKFRNAVRKDDADVCLLSMAPQLARPVRIILGRGLPAYGTSLLSTGGPPLLGASGVAAPVQRAPELDGVRCLEMPAVIDTNFAATLGYPWVPAEYTLEMQRLYALGIDAYRIARAMFSGQQSFDIDGLTGRLRYDGTAPRIERIASVAEYRDGVPVPL